VSEVNTALMARPEAPFLAQKHTGYGRL